MAIVKAVNGPGQVTNVKKITVGRPISTAAQTSTNINSLQGIDTSGKVDGSVLVYSTSSQNWEATLQLEKQEIIGGNY